MAEMPTGTPYRLRGRRIWVAGHNGMVGQALVRRLRREDCTLLLVDRAALDLRRQADVEAWLAAQRPDTVILAAAKVGGIQANSRQPADFAYDNIAIQTNVIQGSYINGVEKLLFLGSSCIYPRLAPQPISEDALLSGSLEETNQWYAIAKISGLKMCQAYRRQYGVDYISAMPTNLYGPGDNFDLETSHVVPALLRKIHAAHENALPSVEIWGTGNPRREFMHVDDTADALIHLLVHYSGEPPVNVGTGSDVTIRQLAEAIGSVVGFQGHFRYNTEKPDGTPRKLLDVSTLASLGWRSRISLEAGLSDAYAWMKANMPRR